MSKEKYSNQVNILGRFNISIYNGFVAFATFYMDAMISGNIGKARELRYLSSSPN